MGTYWVIGGDKDGTNIGSATASLLHEIGHRAVVTDKEVDVTQRYHINAALDFIADEAGDDFAGAVYSAGINKLSWIGETELQDVADMFGTNTIGFANVIECLVRRFGQDHMTGEGKALSIVAVSSDAAERPLRTSAAYCASKAALNSYVKVAARELGPHSWRINAVSPGMTEGTPMTNSVDRQVADVRGWAHDRMMAYERTQEVTPGRVPVESVARVIVDTITGPDHLNGAIIPVNGGR